MQTGNIEQQKPAVEARCRDMGWEIVARFEEQASAFSDRAFKRDAFTEMMRYCRDNRGKVGNVVVWDIKRFARSVEAFIRFQAELNSLGIHLEILNLPPETTPVGNLTRVIMAAMAEHGSAIDAEASVRGTLKAQREDGVWPHQAPVGFKTNPIRRAMTKTDAARRTTPCLIIDKAQGAIVCKLLREFSTGRWTVMEVYKRAVKNGLRTKGGKTVPAYSRVRAMLESPVYVGKMIDRETGEVLPGNWEPLIDMATYEKIQALLKKNNGAETAAPSNGNGARAYRKLREDFALKSVVHCAHCGEFLTAYWNNAKHIGYYRCFRPDCRRVHTRKDVLEGEFLALIDRVQPTTEFLEKMRQRVLASFKKTRREKIDSRKPIQADLDRIEEKRRCLVDAFVYEKAIDQATYDSERNRLDAEERTLLERLEAVRQSACIDVAKLADAAVRNLSDFRRRWERGSLESKMAVQRIAFPQGLKFDGKHFLTPVTGIFCNDLRPCRKSNNSLAPRAGIEPAFKP